jgi:hypothetical protein
MLDLAHPSFRVTQGDKNGANRLSYGTDKLTPNLSGSSV